MARRSTSELTPMQEKFCAEYVKCGVAAEAHRRAGYSVRNEKLRANSAAQVFRNPKVQARIKAMQEKIEKKNIADAQEIQETLTRILRQYAEEEVVASESTGRTSRPTIVTKKASLRDVIQAASLLGKSQGMFIERYNIEGGLPIVIKEDLE